MYTCIAYLLRKLVVWSAPGWNFEPRYGNGWYYVRCGCGIEWVQFTYLQYICVQKSKLSAAISIINYLKFLKLLFIFRNDAILRQHCLWLVWCWPLFEYYWWQCWQRLLQHTTLHSTCWVSVIWLALPDAFSMALCMIAWNKPITWRKIFAPTIPSFEWKRPSLHMANLWVPHNVLSSTKWMFIESQSKTFFINFTEKPCAAISAHFLVCGWELHYDKKWQTTLIALFLSLFTVEGCTVIAEKVHYCVTKIFSAICI